MKFSLLSWNVEKFKGQDPQLKQVVNYIKSHNPDIFGLFEVENIDIIELISKHLSEYDYSLTDGPENKEILVGIRRGKFSQWIFSQKREFKVFNPALRPGALLSAILAGEFYNILFLHTDSGTEAPSFGNRNEMFEKIWALKKALDKKSGQDNNSKLIVLGDLNTMGLKYPSQRQSDRRISEPEEIDALEKTAKQYNLDLIKKEFNQTFFDGSKGHSLDHILATSNIRFKEIGTVDNQPFYVKVTGWQQLEETARKEFVKTISDHCLLYCEII